MSETTRFGVSMDARLLREFDAYCRKRGYANRSEAIRDRIRDVLVEDFGTEAGQHVAGTLTLVYDHHTSDLSQRLTAAQHDAHHLILSTLHVHLDHDNCLEVLALRGESGAIRTFAERMLAVKGVKHGKFVLTATGKEFR